MNSKLEELRGGYMRANSRLAIEGPGWAAPIYWLESLPRARWWACLRDNGYLILSFFGLLGSLWGSWYLWKWFVRALLAE